MGMKIAVVIGDYSNGWSDATIVQDVSSIPTQKNLLNDRDYVLNVLTKHLSQVISEIESNEKINPFPKDEPCCEKFSEWVKTLTEMDKEVKLCPYCGKKITDERRKKFICVN